MVDPASADPNETPRSPIRSAVAVVAVLAAGILYLSLVAETSLVHATLAVTFCGVALVALLSAAPQPQSLVAKRPKASGPWPDRRLKTVMAALGQSAVLVDGKGVIRYVNPIADRAFPTLRPGDPLAVGLRVPDLIDALSRVIASGADARVEWTSRVPSERWFEARLAGINDPPRATGPGTNPDFVLLAIEDLTEQHRLERMRADFVANASHELRTPLAALSGFIETLQGPARADERARDQFLGIMSEQARRMKRLIDDLLSLSRAEMKAHQPITERADLVDVIGRVATALAPLVSGHAITLDIRRPDAPVAVPGEADELVQVFSNLIENAIKYGGDGRTVTVAFSALDGEDGRRNPVVTVADQGPGIAPEHLPRLTERFYRADVASSRAKQGTGLGLAIVKHILTRHQARLSISSKVGEGSTFAVIFGDTLKKP